MKQRRQDHPTEARAQTELTSTSAGCRPLDGYLISPWDDGIVVMSGAEWLTHQ